MSDGTPFVRWLGGRLALALLVVSGVTSLTFVLIHLSPGDPVYLLAGDGGSPAYYAEMRAKYALDEPLAEQFLRYAGAVLAADFGYSFMYQQPVTHVLSAHLPATVLLGAAALLLAVVFGFGAALVVTAWPVRAVDAAVRVLASVLYAAPVFWTGQVLIFIAAVKLGWFPTGGTTSARVAAEGLARVGDVLWHLALPALALSLPLAAVIARVGRATMRETLREPHVHAARARGLPWRRVVASHVARNALVPVVTIVAHQAGQIVAGAALLEALFGWPGVGHLVLHASSHRDYPLVTGAFIGISTAVVLCNVAADAVAARLDPRIPLS